MKGAGKHKQTGKAESPAAFRPVQRFVRRALPGW
jgi:hypothetical protein